MISLEKYLKIMVNVLKLKIKTILDMKEKIEFWIMLFCVAFFISILIVFAIEILIFFEIVAAIILVWKIMKVSEII